MFHETEETRRKENRRGDIIAIGFALFMLALNLFLRALG